jgi:hypothetical protein
MTEPKIINSWAFAFGKKKIHYFYTEKSLCGIVEFGYRGSKKPPIDNLINFSMKDPSTFQVQSGNVYRYEDHH